MPNDTSCSPFGNCTVLVGTKTNGTFYTPQYDPTYPIPYWHKNMGLATIWVCNSLTRKAHTAYLDHLAGCYRRSCVG